MRLVVAALVVLAGTLVLAPPARSEAPEILSHQGHLILPDGVSAPDGSYRIRFAIFGTPTGGVALFERDLTVRVEQGVYHVLLSGAPGELAEALRGAPRHLELAVLSGPGVTSPAVLAPREEIGAVPFARFARTAALADALTGAPGSGGFALPTGAVLLSAEATCPPGFEPLDGSSQQGGAPHDMRGRIPLGADLGGSDASVPDGVGVTGGTSSHRHARGSQLMDLGTSYVAAGSASSIPSPQHHHSSSSNCPGSCFSSYTAALPPVAALTFCRKI